MKYTAVVTITVDAKSRIEAKEKLKEKFGTCEIVIKNKIRTQQQNKALHFWFTQVAELLNNTGFDMRVFLQEGVDIRWSPYTIKEHIFRPTMTQLFGYKSTKDLKTTDIDAIFEVISKAIGERTGEYAPFPCIESLMSR